MGVVVFGGRSRTTERSKWPGVIRLGNGVMIAAAGKSLTQRSWHSLMKQRVYVIVITFKPRRGDAHVHLELYARSLNVNWMLNVIGDLSGYMYTSPDTPPHT